MIINAPTSFANAVAPFNPLGRQPVGEETGENRETPLAPVVEVPEPERNVNQRAPDERRGEVEQRIGLTERQASDDSSGESETRQQQQTAEARQRDEQEQRQLVEDQQLIRQLAERDREVRAHEQAHAAVGGELAGAPSFTYQRGPDGNNYATGGEVPISLGEVAGNAEQTIRNAQRVQQAALAPAEPSSQDRRVAAAAAQLELSAQQDLVRETQEAGEALEAEQQAEREERLAADEQREQTRQQAQSQGRVEADERNARQAEATSRSLELNRRLLDAGVSDPGVDVGRLLNQQV